MRFTVAHIPENFLIRTIFYIIYMILKCMKFITFPLEFNIGITFNV